MGFWLAYMGIEGGGGAAPITTIVGEEAIEFTGTDTRPHYRAGDIRPHYRSKDTRPHYLAEEN